MVCLCAHPYGLQSFDLLVQSAVDVTGVEQRVSGNLAQQVPGEVADVVLAEVPLPQHSAGDHRLGVLMAALAEVTAEVFTITQSLDVICGGAAGSGSEFGIKVRQGPKVVLPHRKTGALAAAVLRT